MDNMCTVHGIQTCEKENDGQKLESTIPFLTTVHHHFVSAIPDVLESVIRPLEIGNFTSNLFERQAKQMMLGCSGRNNISEQAIWLQPWQQENEVYIWKPLH